MDGLAFHPASPQDHDRRYDWTRGGLSYGSALLLGATISQAFLGVHSVDMESLLEELPVLVRFSEGPGIPPECTSS